MEFSLNSLKIFTTLVKVKNFTETANQLGMTQPGVSQHIKSLETYFEAKLIKLFGKSFELTPEGEKVLSYTTELFYKHELFKEELKQDAKYEGLCKMASPGAIGIKLYGLLLQLNKKHPGLTQSFNYTPNRSIEQQLLSNEIDLGIMSILPNSNLLIATEVSKEELLLLIPKTNRINSFEQFMDLGFINHPDGMDMALKIFRANFKKEFKGISSLNIKGGNNQINRILEPVSMGLGFTVLPHFAYDNFKEKNRVIPFTLKKRIFNSIYIVKKRERILPKRYQLIEEYITDHL